LLFATSQTQSALRPIQTAASSATDFITPNRDSEQKAFWWPSSRKHSGGHNARPGHDQGADEAKK
jgi:hypothetical protein